ncbi:DUF58 domain-containing protein [Cerasicoccus frondis]|uniref:DUF58 domain-containing protein n=1 Tax=Cerasicoccus frondis TaxID=490090 RepID=UPI0028528360|nr:DUF58 domain-containing protein [Cerasicoccus frondis]
MILSKDQLSKLRRLELKTRKLAVEILSGSYHSAYKGRGLDFEEVRAYQHGDDVRTIDWNVTARTRTPHVRRFREEREHAFVIMVDISASGLLGSGERNKRELAAEIASTLAFSALSNNDRVALILFSDQVEKFIPLGKGQAHVFRIIKEILYTEPQSPRTNIAEALSFLNNVFPRRSVTMLISDFLDNSYERPLKTTTRRHDLLAIHIYDPHERELPNVGWICLRDSETGAVVEVNTSDPIVRSRFARQTAESWERVHTLLRRTKTDYIEVSTTANFHMQLRQFFDRRAAHSR